MPCFASSALPPQVQQPPLLHTREKLVASTESAETRRRGASAFDKGEARAWGEPRGHEAVRADSRSGSTPDNNTFRRLRHSARARLLAPLDRTSGQGGRRAARFGGRRVGHMSCRRLRAQVFAGVKPAFARRRVGLRVFVGRCFRVCRSEGSPCL